jgi:hypothetical protein
MNLVPLEPASLIGSQSRREDRRQHDAPGAPFHVFQATIRPLRALSPAP